MNPLLLLPSTAHLLCTGIPSICLLKMLESCTVKQWSLNTKNWKKTIARSSGNSISKSNKLPPYFETKCIFILVQNLKINAHCALRSVFWKAWNQADAAAVAEGRGSSIVQMLDIYAIHLQSPSCEDDEDAKNNGSEGSGLFEEPVIEASRLHFPRPSYLPTSSGRPWPNPSPSVCLVWVQSTWLTHKSRLTLLKWQEYGAVRLATIS